MTVKPAPVKLTEAEARALAAQGGWEEAPMCAFRARQQTAWAWIVATWFGAGWGKPGPGTWGSIAAVLIWSAVALLGHPSPVWLMAMTVAGVVVVVAIGVPAATIAARESGSKDPGFVVVDEVAGQWIALIGAKPDLQHILLALLLFRAFDIFKPFPVRQLEKLPEGWGIVFDDVAAGMYAWAVMLLLQHWMG